MLKKYVQSASKDVYSVYTGDELWVHEYEPETNNNRFMGLPRRAESIKSCSSMKHIETNGCLFFRHYPGQVATVSLEKRRMVNFEWYTTIYLPEVIK
ncbi:hypothetical protein TNCV_1361211 [Trichonephila clavipes]|nr:hypothetical protein TNCV_1361211 [Trichonephila clavipes]